MNYVLTLMTLLILASCKVEESSQNKSCTLNGQPINCTNEGSNRNANTADEPTDAVTITSISKSKITISEGQIEFLENSENTARETRNGNEFECGSGTAAGFIVFYKLEGNKLHLMMDDNSKETYTRVSMEGKKLQGTWRNVSQDEMGTDVTILSITEDSFQMQVACTFNT